MKDDRKELVEIQGEIGHMADIIGQLSRKYRGEPLLEEAQRVFLSLSVHVGKALNIQLQ